MKEYSTIIIGSGVSGTSQLFMLSKYTNLDNFAIIEKERNPGMINSKSSSNSQTLHAGDIETNYKEEKAKIVSKAASYTAKYVESKGVNPKLYLKTQKMVIGVGEIEVKALEKRFKWLKNIYPTLEKIGIDKIKKIEPNLLRGRKKSEKIIALYNPNGHTINYGNLSRELLNDSLKTSKKIDKYFQTKVSNISRKDGFFYVKTNKGILKSKVVIVSCGAHSLFFAKKLGYVEHYSLLSVAGNFYFTPKMLNSKVYTLQDDRLPFAAVHGDPDIDHPNKTRFGPTTNIVFMLERGKYGTVLEYMKTFGFKLKAFLTLIKILSDKHLLFYAIKHNIYFRLPFIGRYIFMKEARKIIPSLKFSDVKLAKGYGGVRPQIVNTDKMTLEMGEARISGENILFNVTPSPGASTCISNSFHDTFKIMDFFEGKIKFNNKQFEKDFS